MPSGDPPAASRAIGITYTQRASTKEYPVISVPHQKASPDGPGSRLTLDQRPVDRSLDRSIDRSTWLTGSPLARRTDGWADEASIPGCNLTRDAEERIMRNSHPRCSWGVCNRERGRERQREREREREREEPKEEYQDGGRAQGRITSLAGLTSDIRRVTFLREAGASLLLADRYPRLSSRIVREKIAVMISRRRASD